MDSSVSVIPCGSYDPAAVRAALTAAITAAGGLDWVRPGMRIGIKLNLCMAKRPESAAVTHPVMAAELARLLTERGAHVVLGDSPGGPFTQVYLGRVYEVTGMKQCLDAGAELNGDFSADEVEYPEGVSLKSFRYTNWLRECDAVINFCKLKSHGLTGITAAVKNLYGVIPGTLKSEYHFLHTDPLDFSNMLIDLNEYVKPRLCLCDAVEVMEGNGPTMGTPRHLGLVLAGRDPYEMDRVCAALLSVREKEIPFLTAAKQRGLLSEMPDEMPVLVEQYRLDDFTRSGATSCWFIRTPEDRGVRKLVKGGLYLILRSKPVVREGCVGCGQCAERCPANAIELRDGQARIDRKKCVRCFCCQEFCPVGAMQVKRSLVGRIVSGK